MNRLRLAVGAATAALLVALAGCGKRENPWAGLPGPPRVMVTFPPLDCFVRNVAGDRAGVMCLCTTKGPHDYAFSIDECMKLKDADLFFSNGLGLDDHFADRMTGNSGNPRLRSRKLGDELPERLRRKGENDHGHHHHHGPGEEHHHHGIWDPHAWLGVPQAIEMVKHIRDDLKAVDPQGAAIYDENARIYIDKLKKLHEEGKKELAGLKTPVVTFHEAMAYFADSYGLKVVGSINPEGGQETTS
jgi:ABC-type Zn uptake system ZnuABC Zn-binding protein ZnuA